MVGGVGGEGGEGGGGVTGSLGVGFVGAGGVSGASGFVGGRSSGMRNQPGLNPNRVRGFETPSLNDMRARQGAIVAKFMTFFKRKCSLVVEMYQHAFYKQKPNWDTIADFIHNDLCNTVELRKGVVDVQFHPVKMLIFIRFNEENLRDETVTRLQSAEGVTWSDYKVKVKGYSLDAEVKFIRLLGVSPETREEEIKKTFIDVGVGEVTEIKKGFLDASRLPGVTNGTWSLRVKILDPDKVIPSYIHRRDEGELWSLNFEGRVFCCWKCGSGGHIGDKCRDQTRTFDEIFSGINTNEGEIVKPTWAAVVRSGGGSEVHENRVNEIEKQLKEDNLRKDKEKVQMENQEQLEKDEVERQRQKDRDDKQNAIDKAGSDARNTVVEDGEDVTFEDDSVMVKLVESSENERVENIDVSQIAEGSVSEAGVRASHTAFQHIAWLEARAAASQMWEPITIVVNPELVRIFGPVATRLAIEYERNEASTPALSVWGEGGTDVDGQEVTDQVGVSDFDDSCDKSIDRVVVASTPKRRRSRGRDRESDGDNIENLSPIREPFYDGDIDGNEDKKLKLDFGKEGSEDEVDKSDDGSLQVGENSRDMLVDQQGAVCEGESETVPHRGEGGQQADNLSFELTSICELWKSQDSPNSDSSLEGDVTSGSGASNIVLPIRQEEKCGVCNLVKLKDAAKGWTVGMCKRQGYCKDEA